MSGSQKSSRTALQSTSRAATTSPTTSSADGARRMRWARPRGLRCRRAGAVGVSALRLFDLLDDVRKHAEPLIVEPAQPAAVLRLPNRPVERVQRLPGVGNV